MIKLARRRGLDVYPAPLGQKIRIGRRNARAGETEEFLATLVRANRAIDDASRGKVDMSCASALPKDLGDWAGTVEFVLGANATGKDLKDLSAIDKAPRAGPQRRDRLPPGPGHADRASSASRLPLALSTPASRIAWSGRDVTVETPAGKIAARAAIVTVSTNVLAAGNIKFTPDLPKRQLDAAAKLSLGSYDRIALQLPGNPLGPGARRHHHRAEQFDADGAAVRQYRDRRRCARSMSPARSAAISRPGRGGDGGVRGGMADQTVRQRMSPRRSRNPARRAGMRRRLCWARCRPPHPARSRRAKS